MIPMRLSDWSTDKILDLLRSGVFEAETFDFKESLPHAKDEGAKERLRLACAAFANSEGGFLVFGVRDERTLPPVERVHGIDPGEDLPERFGNYPRACSPSVQWTFRNPPISLESGRLVHVVHIPKSSAAPHAVGDPGAGWQFPKRTNKGTEGMNIQEVRAGFLSFYEKRLKLQLLRSELVALKQDAASAYVADPARIGDDVSLVSFDISVIESVLADTYTLTAQEHGLHSRLTRIRQLARSCNNRIRLIFGVAYMPLSNKDALIRKHNEDMKPACEQLTRLCDEAMSHLDGVLEA